MYKRNECIYCGRYWNGGGKCPDCRTYKYLPLTTLNEDTGREVLILRRKTMTPIKGDF